MHLMDKLNKTSTYVMDTLNKNQNIEGNIIILICQLTSFQTNWKSRAMV